MDKHSPDQYQLDTLAVRSGIHRSQFGEHSEAMYLTSSFVFDNAQQAADAFQKGIEGRNVYSRFTNPTVTAFEERLAALEAAGGGSGTGAAGAPAADLAAAIRQDSALVGEMTKAAGLKPE
jgi:O-acetylhomoserine/O-acetylserine sulfhydrylase-like pyridoxal-dependent enzyme